MSYRKRVIIFLGTMATVAVILVVIFAHVTVRELRGMNASSIPLPAVDAQDQQELQNMLHSSLNTKDATQNTQGASATQNAPTQQPIDTQTPPLEIPAKAIQN